MQKLVTCGHCGQAVYVDTESQVALACPTCRNVLQQATPSTVDPPAPDHAHSSDQPLSSDQPVSSDSAEQPGSDSETDKPSASAILPKPDPSKAKADENGVGKPVHDESLPGENDSDSSQSDNRSQPDSKPIPQATIPQSDIPLAKVPQATIPQATIPQATVPQALVPQAIVPSANVPVANSPPSNIQPGNMHPVDGSMGSQPPTAQIPFGQPAPGQSTAALVGGRVYQPAKIPGNQPGTRNLLWPIIGGSVLGLMIIAGIVAAIVFYSDSPDERDNTADFGAGPRGRASQPIDQIDLSHLKTVANDGTSRSYRWTKGKSVAYKYNVTLSHLADKIEIAGENRITATGLSPRLLFPDTEELGGSTGTCFFIHPDGLAVTCAHVVDGYRKVEVLYRGNWIDATVVAFDSRNDLALLMVGARNVPFLRVSKSSDVKLAQPIHVVGFPIQNVLGNSVKFNTGAVTGINRTDSSEIQFDATINPGNSGGPIIDQSGNVIAIASKMFKNSELSAVGIGVESNRLIDLLYDKNVRLPLEKNDHPESDNSRLASKTTPSVCLVRTTERSGLGVVRYRSTVRLGGDNLNVRSPAEKKTTGRLLIDETGDILASNGAGLRSVFFFSPASMGLMKLDRYGAGFWQDKTLALIGKPEHATDLSFLFEEDSEKLDASELVNSLALVTSTYRQKSSTGGYQSFECVRHIESFSSDISDDDYLEADLNIKFDFDTRNRRIAKQTISGMVNMRYRGKLKSYHVSGTVELDEENSVSTTEKADSDNNDPEEKADPNDKQASASGDRKKGLTGSGATIDRTSFVHEKTDNRMVPIEKDSLISPLFIGRFELGKSSVKSLDFATQKSNRFLIGLTQQSLISFDIDQGRQVDELKHASVFDSNFRSIKVLPNGRTCLVYGRADFVMVFSISESGKLEYQNRLLVPKQQPIELAISRDSDTVASYDLVGKGTITVWSLQSGSAKVHDLTGILRKERIHAMLLTGADKATIATDTGIKQIDLKSGDLISETTYPFGDNRKAELVILSGDGKHVLVKRRFRSDCDILPADLSKSLWTGKQHLAGGVFFSDSQFVLIRYSFADAEILDLRSGNCTPLRFDKTYRGREIAVSSDSGYFAISKGSVYDSIMIGDRTRTPEAPQD